MSEQESKKPSVISIAFATGEGISPEELPVLRMEWTYSGYKLVEGRELIEAALMQSMRKGKEPSWRSDSNGTENNAGRIIRII